MNVLALIYPKKFLRYLLFLMVVLGFYSVQAQVVNVSTFAGTAGSSGTTDGTGASARFNNPAGAAFDGSGNLFVADYTSGKIRKITPAGVVSTFATVPSPIALAIDRNDIYVADYLNHVIRKVTSAGVVSVFSGSVGNAGTSNGNSSSARFTHPSGIAVNHGSGGTAIYVSDASNRVRSLTPSGNVSNFAGSGTSGLSNSTTLTSARFANPKGLVLDGSGNLYVADYGNNVIRKVTTSGAGGVTTFATGLNNPAALDIDNDGNVYVGNNGNHKVVKITSAGVVTVFAGTGVSGTTDGAGTVAKFNQPYGIAVDANDNVFVCDYANHTIRKITEVSTGTISGTTAMCAGTSTNLSVALSGNQPWSLTYTDGTTPVSVTNITASPYTISVSPASTKTYTLTSMSDVNGAGTFSGSAVIAIQQNGTVPEITGAVSFCKLNGQNTSALSYTCIAVAGATSYSWSYSGTPVSVTGTTTSTTITMDKKSESGNVIVKAVGPACPASDTLAVVLNTSIPGAAGAITGTNSVCAGQTGVAYSVGAITNASTYTWVYSGTGATINGTTNTPTIDYSLTATGGNLTVRGTNGCGSGTVSANYPVTINARPTVNAVAVLPVCSESATNIALVSSPAGGTFTWGIPVSEPANAVTNGTSASGVSGPIAQTLSNVTASSATLTYAVIATLNGCTSSTVTNIVQTVYPLVRNQTVWTGSTNTDWATATNWVCNGVPTAAIDAMIPSGLSRYPTIGATANTKSITLAAGSALSFLGTNTLNVSGNWVNNGAIVMPQASTVVFTGATNTSISGTGTSDFYNLKMNKTSNATLTVSSAVNLSEKLSFGTAAINTLAVNNAGGGSFVFKSDATSTAHVDVLTAPYPVLSGNFTCQKYFPAQTGRYNFMLGVPVTNAKANAFQPSAFDGSGNPTNGIYITGPFIGTNTGPGMVTTAFSAFSYNPATGLYTGYPANGTNIATTALTAGQGYRMSVRDGGTAKSVVAKTFSVNGALTAPGPFTFSNLVSGTNTKPFSSIASPSASTIGGWNLVSNPYMSDISIDLSQSANWTHSNMGNTVYIFNAKTRDYAACASGVPTENCKVSAFQGFFVKATGTTPALTIKEGAKIRTGNTTQLYRVTQSSVLNYLGIKLTSGATSTIGNTYIRYVQGASYVEDEFDGFKLGAGNRTALADLGLFTSASNGTFYDVNAKPYYLTTDTTEMNVKLPIGDAALDFTDISNLESGYSISLYDKFTKTLTDVNANPVYKFAATSDSNSTGPRFQVIFNRGNVVARVANGTVSDSPAFNIYPNPGHASNIRLAISNYTGNIDIEVFDLLGNLVYMTQKNVDGKIDMLLALPSDLAPGLYMVDVEGVHNFSFTWKLIIK